MTTMADDEPRIIGGDLNWSWACYSGDHADCAGEWTDGEPPGLFESGPCECPHHSER